MKSIRFIGDVHGKIGKYRELIKGRHTIQVGDLGIGFGNRFDLITNKNHRFIRGNHDSPRECEQHPCWIPDGTIMGKVMFIGGGYSIDHHYRVPGIDWWPDEELSDFEFENMMGAYEMAQPEVMITHECPSQIAEALFGPCPYNLPGMKLPDRTSLWFDAFWQLHKPKYWIFGHYHKRRDQVISGTRFVCLEELGVFDIDLEEADAEV